MSYYTRERLGPKQSLTPEGFLLAEAVPIARTGTMVYGPGEIPVEPGPDGIIHVERYPEDVFHPDTIASFNGKPVVDGHPEGDVAPDNWNNLAVGVTLNPRRGAAAQDDVLLADLLITQKDAIEAVRNGLREVSCGYDAKYFETVPPIPGRARQTQIIGNHVALVDNGRCGPRCSIGDRKTVDQEMRMTWLEKLKAAWGAKDQAAFDAALAEAPKGETTTVILREAKTKDEKHKEDCDCAECKDSKTKDRTMDARMKKVEDSVDAIGKDVKTIKDAFEKKEKEEEEEKKKTEDNEKIEGSLEMEAPPGTGDEAKKAKDSAYLSDSWQEAVSLAEIIAPGYKAPTFDAKASPVKTFDALCKFRRTVLDLASHDGDTRSFMDSITGGRELKNHTCDGIRTLFRAVGTYKKNANNSSSTADTILPNSGGGTGVRARIKTPAELNKVYAEYYKSN
jgi:hypothetical protein